jgi:hypothetical protein
MTVWDYEALIERIEAIAADIDEMSFDQLSEASAGGELERPKSDRQLMQARRALEKAANALRSIPTAPFTDSR